MKFKNNNRDFRGGLVIKNLPCSFIHLIRTDSNEFFLMAE